jgi:hyperosmotically inducible periplasmic protein
MKNLAKLKALSICVPLVFLLGLTACNKTDTSADTAGEKMDQATDNAGAQVDKATDKAGAAIDDAAVTTKVKAAIAADSALTALQINVDTANGVVTLNGEVDSQANSDKAASIATGVSDVKGVENKLTVKSPS